MSYASLRSDSERDAPRRRGDALSAPFRLKRDRTVLGVALAGILGALTVIYLKESAYRPASLVSIGPGSILNVGEGQDQMALTVDSPMTPDGYVHAYGIKRGVKYAGYVKLSKSAGQQHELGQNLADLQIGGGSVDVSGVPKQYTVEVNGLDAKPCTSAPSSPCPSAGGAVGSSAIQNQNTININMVILDLFPELFAAQPSLARWRGIRAHLVQIQSYRPLAALESC